MRQFQRFCKQNFCIGKTNMKLTKKRDATLFRDAIRDATEPLYNHQNCAQNMIRDATDARDATILFYIIEEQ